MTAAVACPNCGAAVQWSATSKYRPFCSERCRLIDLGAWASERYVVGGAAPEPEAPTDAPEPRS